MNEDEIIFNLVRALANVRNALVYMNNKQSLEVGMSPISKELENLIRRIDLELTQTQESIITRQEIAHH